MKTLSEISPTVAISHTPLWDLESASRLIVLVPDSEADPALLAGRIREIANALENRVQLLALSPDAAHELGVRRRLVTLSALVEDTHIHVETTVEVGSNWLSAIEHYLHDGDVIVCFKEHRVGLADKPLHQILASNLNATIYVISGALPTKPEAMPGWVSNLLAWAGSIVLILLFLMFQIHLLKPQHGWIQSLLLYASLPLECGSLLMWNNFFNSPPDIYHAQSR